MSCMKEWKNSAEVKIPNLSQTQLSIWVDFATSSRRLPTDLVETLKLNMLSRVELYDGRRVLTRRQSWPSFQSAAKSTG